MNDTMLKRLSELTLKGLTVRAIRAVLEDEGHAMSEYPDVVLIQKMIKILGCGGGGRND